MKNASRLLAVLLVGNIASAGTLFEGDQDLVMKQEQAQALFDSGKLRGSYTVQFGKEVNLDYEVSDIRLLNFDLRCYRRPENSVTPKYVDSAFMTGFKMFFGMYSRPQEIPRLLCAVPGTKTMESIPFDPNVVEKASKSSISQ